MGCVPQAGALKDSDYLFPMDLPDKEANGLLRLDITPPPGVFGLGDLEFLPQTVQVYNEFVDSEVQDNEFDLNQDNEFDVTLSPPISVEGQVSLTQVSPWTGAQLPGSYGPLAEARVGFRRPRSVQHPYTTTDENGNFALSVVPDLEFYQLSIISDSPEVPLYTVTERIESPEDVESIVLDIDLGYGAPIWGVVTNEAGQPLAGMSVQAINEYGVTGPASISDDEGRYFVRVLPGQSYWVVAKGQENVDPVLSTSSLFIDEDGKSVDFPYNDLNYLTVRGTVKDEQGVVRDEVTVRFTSTDLTGYPDGNAEHSIEVRPSSGVFTALLLDGEYDMEVVPNDGQPFSPVAVGLIEVSEESVGLSDIRLPPFVAQGGQVLDPDGNPVPGAVITATELGFGERSFSTMADADGTFSVGLPNTPLQFTLTPPGDKTDMALTRHTVNEPSEWVQLSYAKGEVVSGVIRYPISADPEEDQILGGSVVEVSDDAGRLLGIAITDIETGAYEIRVAQSGQ